MITDQIEAQISEIRDSGGRISHIGIDPMTRDELKDERDGWESISDYPEINGVDEWDVGLQYDGVDVVEDTTLRLDEFAEHIQKLANEYPDHTVHATCDGWLPPEVEIRNDTDRGIVILTGTRNADPVVGDYDDA